MRRRDAGIVVLALLLGTVGGYLAGGRRHAASAERDSGDAADVAALRDRVAGLERQVARLSERPPPVATLSGSRQGPSARRTEDPDAGAPRPAAPAGAAGEVKPREGEPLPEAPTTPLVLWQAGPRDDGLEFSTEIDDARKTEILELAKRDPEAAARATRDLWERGTEVERNTALELLRKAQHKAFQALLTDVLGTTPPPRPTRELIYRAAAFKGSYWGAAQLTGAPDVPIAGDHSAAWASLKEDVGEVVLDLDYATAVRVDAVRIHETFNPGAVARVYAKDPAGRYDLLWEGRAESREAIRWFEPSVSTSYSTSSIRIVLDTDRVGGWNEIDAVELVGDGRRQWATGASASSTYGTGQ